MKKIIIAVCFCFLLCSTSYADDSDAYTKCSHFNGLAEAIMKNRQNGISISKQIENLPNNEIKEIVISMIMSAYDSPRYHTESNQRRAVQDFVNECYMICVEALSE